MRIGFLITARLKSSRLPLKLLKDLNGQPVIERVIARAKKVAGCDDVVLCTSPMSQDLPLLRAAQSQDIYYYTGEPEDVLKRLLHACRLFDLDYFIGMTADNPFFSIYHANRLADLIHREPELDYVYTTGLPLGTNVYAIKTKALETVCEVKEIVDTEIWGYLINRPEIFNIQALDVGEEYRRDYRLTLDEPADYQLMRKLYRQFPSPTVPDLADVIELLDNDDSLAAINASVVQRDLDEATKQRIAEFYSQQKTQVMAIKDAIYHK